MNHYRFIATSENARPAEGTRFEWRETHEDGTVASGQGLVAAAEPVITKAIWEALVNEQITPPDALAWNRILSVMNDAFSPTPEIRPAHAGRLPIIHDQCTIVVSETIFDEFGLPRVWSAEGNWSVLEEALHFAGQPEADEIPPYGFVVPLDEDGAPQIAVARTEMQLIATNRWMLIPRRQPELAWSVENGWVRTTLGTRFTAATLGNQNAYPPYAHRDTFWALVGDDSLPLLPVQGRRNVRHILVSYTQRDDENLSLVWCGYRWKDFVNAKFYTAEETETAFTPPNSYWQPVEPGLVPDDVSAGFP